jgi:hypothetical protein
MPKGPEKQHQNKALHTKLLNRKRLNFKKEKQQKHYA